MKPKVSVEIGYCARLPRSRDDSRINWPGWMLNSEADIALYVLQVEAQIGKIVRDEVCDVGEDKTVEIVQVPGGTCLQKGSR